MLLPVKWMEMDWSPVMSFPQQIPFENILNIQLLTENLMLRSKLVSLLTFKGEYFWYVHM